MALTFTNKAAREMKERIGKLVGQELAQHLYMGTFHSIFSRILRAEAQHIGFTNNFTIYDESDSRSLIKTIVKEMGLDEKVYKPASVHSRISIATCGRYFHYLCAALPTGQRHGFRRSADSYLQALSGA